MVLGRDKRPLGKRRPLARAVGRGAGAVLVGRGEGAGAVQRGR